MNYLYRIVNALLAAVVFCFKFSGKDTSKRKGILYNITPFRIFLVGLFLSMLFVMFPPYFCGYFGGEGSVFFRVIKALMFSIRSAIGLFIMDGGFELISSTTAAVGVVRIVDELYQVYCAIRFVTAPIATAGIVLSFFKDTTALLRYLISRKGDVYIISQLDERTIVLAQNIKKEFENASVVFAGAKLGDNPAFNALVLKAQRLGAFCFKKSIFEVNYKRKADGIKRKLFFVSLNEDENIRDAMSTLERFRCDELLNKSSSEFYVFANSRESEVILDNLDSGNIKIRRVDEYHRFALTTLREHSVFNDAKATGGRMKIAVVGMGLYGIELVKALCWCGQMPYHKLEIHVFDRMKDIAARLERVAPDLLANNGKNIPGEANYNIVFHSGVDINEASFTHKICEIGSLTTVYTCLGADEINIECAISIREVLGKMTDKDKLPPILSLVYDDLKNVLYEKNNGLHGIDNLDYGIKFIGSLGSRYNLEFIERKKLEADGLTCHLSWYKSDVCHYEEELKLLKEKNPDTVENYEQVLRETEAKYQESLNTMDSKRELYEHFEYYRRSSLCNALHDEFKKNLGYVRKGDGSETDRMISEYEHRRWNAFMRSEGFTYGTERDYIAKTHPDLIPYEELSQKQKRKDDVVISDITE